MQLKERCLSLIVILLCFIAGSNIGIIARGQVEKIDSLAIVVVIDTSGSMSWTDINSLRKTAVDFMIDELGESDYLGILTFDTKVTIAHPISKIKNIKDKTGLKETLTPYFETNGDTDYKGALEEAQNQLDLVKDDAAKKAIFLISDGDPDPDPVSSRNNPDFMEKYMKALWETVDNLSDNRYPIYSIGLGNGIRSDILEKISTKTGGTFQILDTYDTLTSTFSVMLEEFRTRSDFTDKTEEKNRDIQNRNEGNPPEDDTKMLPIINHNFYIKNEGYRIGEKERISSFLTVGGIKLIQNKEISIQNYELVITDGNGNVSIIPLYDDGSQLHSDITAQDGIWSNFIEFQKEESYSAILRVQGSYDNKSFKVEETVGSYSVMAPGIINLTNTSASKEIYFKGTKGSIITIPFSIENNSSFKEYIKLEMEGDIGSLLQSRITLLPGEIMEVPVKIILSEDSSRYKNGPVYDIIIKLQPENEFTITNPENILIKVEVNSSFDNLIHYIKAIIRYIKAPLLIIIILFLLFAGLGLIFYYVYYYNFRLAAGVLICCDKDSYKTEHKLEHKTEKDYTTFDITILHKEKVIISFNINNPNADYYIKGTRYDYNLIISSGYQISWKSIMEGWKVIIYRTSKPHYRISTTMPGIIEKNNQVFTSMDLWENELFESGGYIFRYIILNDEKQT